MNKIKKNVKNYCADGLLMVSLNCTWMCNYNCEVKQMFKKLSSTNIDANHDYGYIQVFIDYLKEIIEMLKELFSGLTKKDDATTTTGA